MSIEDLARLFQDLEEKPELTRELEEAADVSAFVTVAKRHGYDLTEEELRTSLRPEEDQGELAEDQLERVAGGALIPIVGNRVIRRMRALRSLFRGAGGLGAVSHKV